MGVQILEQLIELTLQLYFCNVLESTGIVIIGFPFNVLCKNVMWMSSILSPPIAAEDFMSANRGETISSEGIWFGHPLFMGQYKSLIIVNNVKDEIFI